MKKVLSHNELVEIAKALEELQSQIREEVDPILQARREAEE